MAVFSILKAIGKGYIRGWYTNCKCRYRLFKGARSTKKSWNILGVEVLMKILQCPERNVVILRNTQSSHKDSTIARLMKLIHMYKLDNYFKFNKTELRIEYKPTGQRIIFKGFDNPDKLTSIEVEYGYLTDVYVEEAFEITDYDAWRKFDGSIRGTLPEGLFHQITFCFNAWNGEHWLNEVFFKNRLEDDFEYLDTHDYEDYLDENYVGDYGIGLYLHTSTYTINEFRDVEVYDKAMEELKVRAPQIYKVEALGMWGSTSGATYPEFNESLIITKQEAMKKRYSYFAIGIDTGFSDGQGKKRTDGSIGSATTMQLIGVTEDLGEIVCLEEYFMSNEKLVVPKTMNEICEEILDNIENWIDYYSVHPDLMKGSIACYVDCADIGTMQNLNVVARNRALFNVRFLPSTKDKIDNRVRWERLLMGCSSFLFVNTPNLIREIKSSVMGEKGEARADGNDHAINANEYAWQPFKQRMQRFGKFKVYEFKDH